MTRHPPTRRSGHHRPIRPNIRTNRRGPAPCSPPKAGSASCAVVLFVAAGALLTSPPLLLAAYFLY